MPSTLVKATDTAAGDCALTPSHAQSATTSRPHPLPTRTPLQGCAPPVPDPRPAHHRAARPVPRADLDAHPEHEHHRHPGGPVREGPHACASCELGAGGARSDVGRRLGTQLWNEQGVVGGDDAVGRPHGIQTASSVTGRCPHPPTLVAAGRRRTERLRSGDQAGHPRLPARPMMFLARRMTGRSTIAPSTSATPSATDARIRLAQSICSEDGAKAPATTGTCLGWTHNLPEKPSLAARRESSRAASSFDTSGVTPSMGPGNPAARET
jgi:hypothetical protein